MNKILVIEDDDTVAKLLRLNLEKNDFDVLVAGDGLQGTTLAENEKPDLIILDLILPVGGGLTVLRNLKKLPHTKNIPVIILSGTSDSTLKEEVNGVGIEDYIEKPCDIDTLIAKIQEILGSKK